MKILIIGHARHGKDTTAEFINKHFGLTFRSSSLAASEIFIYKVLKEKYNYATPNECFEDRVNHRKEWYDLIVNYNKNNKSQLASEILKTSDIYVGMREYTEINSCRNDNLFDLVVGVYNPYLPEEAVDSFNINIWKESDFIIPNVGTKKELEQKIITIFSKLL